MWVLRLEDEPRQPGRAETWRSTGAPPQWGLRAAYDLPPAHIADKPAQPPGAAAAQRHGPWQVSAQSGVQDAETKLDRAQGALDNAIRTLATLASEPATVETPLVRRKAGARHGAGALDRTYAAPMPC